MMTFINFMNDSGVVGWLILAVGIGSLVLVGERVNPCPRAGCGKSARPVRRAGSGNGAW